MQLTDVIGNEAARRALEGMAESGRIPGALMFYENDGCGALALAMAFLDGIYGHDRKVSRLVHPDIHFIFPTASSTKVEGKVSDLVPEAFIEYWRELVSENPYFLENELSTALGIEGKSSAINVRTANHIISTLSLTPVERGYKAVVIYLPEKMNEQAANKLLKVVEEPPEKTVFLMITHAPDKVIPTISSRCQGIRVLPLEASEVASALVRDFGKGEEEAAEAAAMAGGSIGVALDYLSERTDYETWMDIFSDLTEALVARDLSGSLDCGERMAALPSREKQKAFCKFASECLRKIFMTRQGMPGLAVVGEDEKEFYARVSGKLKASFPRRAAAAFDRAANLIGRNVNQKMVFCDLVDRLFLI